MPVTIHTPSEAEAAGRTLVLALSVPPANEAAHEAYLSQIRRLAREAHIGDPAHHTLRAAALHQAACSLVNQRLLQEVAELLFAAGAQPSGFHVSGETSLHAAVRYGNLDACRLLIDHGADAASLTADGALSVLETACLALRQPMSGRTEATGISILQLLLDAGARPRDASPPGRQNALIHLAGGNERGLRLDLHEAVELLLVAGASPQIREQATGRQPLHYAAMRGYWRTALALLKAGAPIRVADERGFTASDYAEQFAVASHEMRAVLRAAEMKTTFASRQDRIIVDRGARGTESYGVV